MFFVYLHIRKRSIADSVHKQADSVPEPLLWPKKIKKY